MAELKELIKTQLDLLKTMGKDRRTIERELGYSEFYIDQVLSKGGNEKIYQALIDYKERFELGDNESPYAKFNIISSQQETIERISKLLEKESKRNEQLEKRVHELEEKLFKSKPHRRSA